MRKGGGDGGNAVPSPLTRPAAGHSISRNDNRRNRPHAGPASNDFAKEHGMRLSQNPQRLIAACLAGVGMLILQGCQESEQNRILFYEKGTYLGEPDEGLSPAQQEALRYRAKITQGN